MFSCDVFGTLNSLMLAQKEAEQKSREEEGVKQFEENLLSPPEKFRESFARFARAFPSLTETQLAAMISPMVFGTLEREKINFMRVSRSIL